MGIQDISDGMLRAWADCGVISSARYVEEVERRRGITNPRISVKDAPPLDYALDAEIDIPGLAEFVDRYDNGQPAGLPVYLWLIGAAVLFGVALWMVWP